MNDRTPQDEHAPNWTPQTWLVAGARDRTPGAPLNVAPVFASNFYLPDDRVYSRSDGTATTDALEALLGGLDGGRALAFASGMAAAAVVFQRLAVGATIAIPDRSRTTVWRASSLKVNVRAGGPSGASTRQTLLRGLPRLSSAIWCGSNRLRIR